jgi:hypothetical protein
MLNRGLMMAVVAGSIVAAPMTGCDSLPGTKRTQGAVIGGAGGAVAGAAHSKGNPLLGALLGGALGAGGGYLIGVQMEHADKKDISGANQAVQNAQSNPATADQARNAATADVNGDGFVTMDEVIAMERAGLSDDQILQKLRASNQIFALTQEQKDYLVSQGVSRRVVNEMDNINRDQRDRYLGNQNTTNRSGEVIGRPS